MAALRIGVHPNNLHLQLAALTWPLRWPEILLTPDGSPAVQFVAYREGRDTGRLIADNVIDVGGTGSTPPVLAQHDGVPLVYVAASAPRGGNGAIVVRAEDGPANVTRLVGRRIALLDGSFHTSFLAAALEREGLSLRDVERVELAPADAYRALSDGRVDAWIAMAPWLERVRNEPSQWRVLTDIGPYVPNRSVFWTHREAFHLHAAALDAVFAALTALGHDIARDPAPYAEQLAAAGISGISESDAAAWQSALAARDWRLLPSDAAFYAEQQGEADLLHRHGVLSHTIDIQQAAPPVPLNFSSTPHAH
ncbi:Putative aliphatic sulfonates-binding protein [Pandoraea iniqua]|uniref:Aliphatic sulfonates-binding protein n=1 Tax=Pandoraea iniqua TaxID=2508288 RepID=A0A5E4XDP0_9BURK|nr:ABC transporter substrate-binding protein [Pandoraea iniqua]VVE34396.1 Putative aliphatic sulfonates-binding protein [Pandoraea iniqua]